jgi:hypothetical protein
MQWRAGGELKREKKHREAEIKVLIRSPALLNLCRMPDSSFLFLSAVCRWSNCSFLGCQLRSVDCQWLPRGLSKAVVLSMVALWIVRGCWLVNDCPVDCKRLLSCQWLPCGLSEAVVLSMVALWIVRGYCLVSGCPCGFSEAVVLSRVALWIVRGCCLVNGCPRDCQRLLSCQWLPLWIFRGCCLIKGCFVDC